MRRACLTWEAHGKHQRRCMFNVLNNRQFGPVRADIDDEQMVP
jgi:hypothetical protein